MSKTIVIAGSLAQKPRQAGHTWQFLQYLLGFKRLGWDVLFIDRLEPEMCWDEAGQPCEIRQSVNLSYFLDVMRHFGLDDSFALICGPNREFVGLSSEEVNERTRNAEFLLNVMGFLTDEEILSAAPRRVFLDTDPGFGQMWQDLGLASLFHGHDDYVTIAENINESACGIPRCNLNWVTWRQPIVLEHWPERNGSNSAFFTSIGSWRGPYSPIEYRGKTYGLRVHEFRKFLDLPQVSSERFQVALDIHSAETKDLELLGAKGWSLSDPQVVARDPLTYKSYIQNSKAEFMATKNIYVDTRSGWFSERSICYLASGKPVLAQDTGIKELYPTGKGLLTFSTIEEAVAGAEEISANYAMHTRAARAIAEEYFDSDKVLPALLRKLNLA